MALREGRPARDAQTFRTVFLIVIRWIPTPGEARQVHTRKRFAPPSRSMRSATSRAPGGMQKATRADISQPVPSISCRPDARSGSPNRALLDRRFSQRRLLQAATRCQNHLPWKTSEAGAPQHTESPASAKSRREQTVSRSGENYLLPVIERGELKLVGETCLVPNTQVAHFEALILSG